MNVAVGGPLGCLFALCFIVRFFFFFFPLNCCCGKTGMHHCLLLCGKVEVKARKSNYQSNYHESQFVVLVFWRRHSRHRWRELQHRRLKLW